MKLSSPRLLWVLLPFWVPAPLLARELAPLGLIIEKVEKGSGWERAGLQPGDVLQAWVREAAPAGFFPPTQGSFRTPFDLAEVWSEQWPRGVVILQGQRNSQPASWPLPRGSRLEWTQLQVTPILSADLLALYRQGREQIDVENLTAGAELWRSAAAAAQARGEEQLGAWFLVWLARAFADAAKWPEADTVYSDALRGLSRPEEAWAAAHLLREWGDLLRSRDRNRAAACFRKALAIDQQSEISRVSAVWSLFRLAGIARNHSDSKAAEMFCHQALAILERLAPESFARIHGYWFLNALSFNIEPSASRQWLQRALELQERLDPESPETIRLLSDLGNVTFQLGDIPAAEEYLKRALELEKVLALNGIEKAYVLNVAGYIAMNRGDLENAEHYLRQGLLIYEKEDGSAGAKSSATILYHLGCLARGRGELETAQEHFLRALTAEEKLRPLHGSRLGEARSLSNLGILERDRGDYPAAKEYLRKSLAIYEQLYPQSLDRVLLLGDLGVIESLQGDFASAWRFLQQALALAKERTPQGRYMAEILSELASVFERQGNWQQAIKYYKQALSLYTQLVPGTADEADVLYRLGVVERQAGHQAAGVEHLCRAVDTLDQQRPKLGGTNEVKSLFEAAHADSYRDCAEALFETDQPEQAFHALERGRARSFLTLLAERDLHLPDLSPQLAADRRRLDAEYDRTQAALFKLGAAPDLEGVERLQSQLREIHRQREALVARIRRESPRFAALQYPEPLDLAGARAALDPGTVLLSYSVGRERSYLFVVRPGIEGSGLSVFPLPVGQKGLREAVRTFQEWIKHRRSDRRGLNTKARSLYDLLLRPAESLLSTSDRLLISPDGPLHTLPFAALVRDGRYLVEWKPLHTVLSATVYAELKKARPVTGIVPSQIVAFGDPSYPRMPVGPRRSITDLRVRSAVHRGLSLTPLPGTRREVEAIAALYPQAQVYLGPEATEERAKAVGREARLVHFACHGLLDGQLPLNSSLALSIPERPAEGTDNGLLQVWEIFEHMRLEADLVTLSACDTALGKELGGEGLISLTRAFQYAGARSVLASLWAVPDAATSRLMPRLYSTLRQGWTKVDALRAAQIEQLRQRKFSHPFYWAAFQLVGDWN